MEVSSKLRLPYLWNAFHSRLSWPQGRYELGVKKNIPASAKNRTLIVEPIDGNFADWSILAHDPKVFYKNWFNFLTYLLYGGRGEGKKENECLVPFRSISTKRTGRSQEAWRLSLNGVFVEGSNPSSPMVIKMWWC
jgi:hypothetical protein